MQFTITREALSEALNTSRRIVGRPTTLPVLSTVRLCAGGASVAFTGTNLDLTLHRNTAVTLRQPGGVCLPAGKLAQIAHALPEGDIAVELDNKQRATITANGSRFVLNGIALDEFPPLPVVPADAPAITLPQQTLKRLLERTAFASSDDSSRFVLQSSYFNFNAGNLTIVGCDGRRLAVATAEVNTQTPAEFIVPAFAAEELGRLLGEEGTVTIALIGKPYASATFTFHDTLLITKLVEGQYPDWKLVMPELTPAVTVDREELKRAAIRTGIISENGRFEFLDHVLTVRSTDAKSGSSVESIMIPKAPKDVAVSCRLKYLIEPLEALSGQGINLHVIDENSPIQLTDSSLPGWRYVLMPIRIIDDKKTETKTEKPKTETK